MRQLFLFHNFWGLVLSCMLLASSVAFAETPSLLGEQDHFYLDKTQLVIQQISLLKKRRMQATQELEYLQHQRKEGFVSLPDDQANKFLLYKTSIQLASTQSTLDSISIESTDSQQALTWLEKNTQEIENQLGSLNIFGLKLAHENPAQIQALRSELKYQENLYQLEKTRAAYLLELQKIESAVFQLYRERYLQINAFLKSRKLLHIKERQVKSELEFQEQQSYWLQQLDALYRQMKAGQGKTPKGDYLRLESEIFNANENINLVYLKTLLTRYQDQLRQMRLSVSRTSSISLLNTLSDQVAVLGKQIVRIDGLVNDRVQIIKKRSAIYLNEKQNKTQSQPALLPPVLLTVPAADNSAALSKFLLLENAYQSLHNDVALLNKRLINFRGILDKAIQHELSARQGLPGFSADAWLDLGKEALLVPMLSFKLLKGFTVSVLRAFQQLTGVQWLLFLLLESIGVMIFSILQKALLKRVSRIPEVINAKYLLSTVVVRNLEPLALVANLWGLFFFLALPRQEYAWLMALAWVWLLFRAIALLARTALVETLHDGGGSDVKLYRSLRAIFAFGAVVTAVTVFLHQLPFMFEMKDFFDRLFLLLSLLVSLLILCSWRVVPGLIVEYIDPRQMYLRRTIYFMGVFIPGLLFVNSLVGLFGFVNLVWMIAWYEGIFTLLLVGYFLLRGLLSDGMEAISTLMIAHVNNGWLLTEAFLKPLHTILRLSLFLGAWTLLFVFYGWDQQSPAVERLNNLLMYPIVSVLNTTITPLSILELVFALALFYWAARWVREFVFRLLLSKTKDIGIRNSIAILSQYAVVILGVFICLKLLGIDLHALFLVASGLLIAVSFGLRDLVNNFACGLLLLFERPVRVGDIVCVSNQEGRVTHIGSRAVSIRTWDHMEIIVPNTELFNKSFINWTSSDDIVRSVITIKIDREDNPHQVQEVIAAVLKGHKDVLSEPAPEVFMKDIIDTMTEFEVRYFINVRQVVSRVAVRSDVLFALWTAFAKHGIKGPNLQHEIVIKNQQPLLPAPR